MIHASQGIETTGKEDIMTDQERAELLAAAEKNLEFLKRGMDEALHKGNFPLAWYYYCKHDGAVYMLKALELLSCEDAYDRTESTFNRYMADRFPKRYQMEGN